MIEIKDGAIFISDAHENSKSDKLYKLLLKIQKKEIKTNQIFFMGDMFDLLIGEISYTKKFYKKQIELINKLAKELEIYYIEGNHDFNLKKVFKNVKVFPISSQPVRFKYHNKTLLLSHGDFTQNIKYTIFTKLIRSKFLLYILNIVDICTKNSISKKIINSQLKKDKCHKTKNFYTHVKQNLQKYDIQVTEIDFICEGHHHQGVEFLFDGFKYINFNSYTCDKKYYKIAYKDEIKFIKFS